LKTQRKQEHNMNPNFSFSLEIALKSTLVLTVAFGAARLLRSASASGRHLLWITAIVSILAIPLLSRITPAWTPPPAVAKFQPAAPPRIAAVEAQTVQTQATPSNVVQLLWIAGALIVLARLAAGTARTWQLSRAARPIQLTDLTYDLRRQLGLRRSIRLLEGGPAAMPMTWGVFRPSILLPKNDWPADRLRVVLAHEMVHVRRFDYLTQLLSQFACAVYWWNPLVWLAAAQLRRERERACDDGVLRLGANAPSYAEHLVDLARSLKSAQPNWSAAVAMASPSYLEERLIALLDRTRNRKPISGRRVAVAAIAAACVILPLAALKARAQAAKGTIAGTVYDISNGAVPGASVTASNRDTKTRETTTTNEAGEYRFPNIPTGHYDLEVKKPGFAIFHRANLLLTADAALNFDPRLEMGGVNENIEVIGNSPNRRQALPGNQPPRRLRIGGDVQATKLISQVKPIYPENAQRQGIEGTVLLHAVIATDGSLLSVGVVNTLADPELANAAMDAVKQWRYQPTLLNGNPVEVLTTISVNFRLQK
jgi:TonB family protein